MHHTLKAEPAMAVLTPYAQARFAHNLYCMNRDYEGETGSFVMRLYMYCVAVELGMKAAILGEDCTVANKARMKALGHDLVKLNGKFEATFGTQLLDEDDVEALQKINSHFKQKGLEYFTGPVLESTLKGYSNLPTLEEMQTVAGKVDAFLAERDFYIDGKTSDTPTGKGLIHFV